MRQRFFGAMLLCLAAPVFGAEPTLVDLGYRQMYNLQFEEAHRSFQEWQRLHPDDPLGPVSDAAAYLFAEFDRLRILQSEFFVHEETFMRAAKPKPDRDAKKRFEAALAHSRELADRILARAPQDDDATFAAILCTGIHADYLALIEKRYMASLGEVKLARGMAQKLLARNPKYYDAYLAIGVENYLLSTKMAPLRWLLRLGGAQTDREEGLRNLRLTAQHGRYLRPYAELLLAVAALRDNDRNRAKLILQALAGQYPRNPLYEQELARLQ